MRGLLFVSLLLSLYTYIFSQTSTITVNEQILSNQQISANQQCSSIYTIQGISHDGYMDIAASYSPTSRIMIFLSFNQDPKDPYLIGTSTQISAGTEVLHATFSTTSSNPLYVKLCRVTGDTSLVTFSMSVNFHCSETSYSNGVGFGCTNCPANSTRPLLADVTGPGACKCNVNTYKSYDTAGNFVCINCPYGAFCKGGDEQPKPLDGFFPLNNGGSMLYVKCPFANSCLHSLRNGTLTKAPIDVDLPVWFPPIPIQMLLNKSIAQATTGALCSDGYTGYLCGQCDSSYFRVGERCLSCGNQNTSNFLIVLYTLGLIVVFIITIPITVMNTHVSSFGIMLNFIQICALFNMFSLKWSDHLQTFFDLLSLTNLNIQLFRPECVTPQVGYFAKFMVIIFIPAMYFVVSFIPLIVSILCMKFCKMPYFTRKRFVRLLSWTINSWFSFCIVQGYVMLSSWTLAFYSCDNYGKLLTNLPAEDKMSRHLWHSNEICSSDNRAFGGYLFMFWVGLGVYVLGIPLVTLALWYLLVGFSRWRARRALRSQDKKDVKINHDILGIIGLGSSTGDMTSNKPSAQVKQEATKATSPDASTTGSPSNSVEDDEKQKTDLLNKLSREIRLSTTSLLVEGRTTIPIVSGLEARKDIIRMFGSFYHRYRPRHFYWELFVFLRKILIVLCFAYLEERPVVAVVLSSFVLLFALVLHLHFQPYRKHTSNILESLLLMFQYCMLVLGLMYYAADDSDGVESTGYSSAVTTVVTVFIILGLSIGAFVFVLEMIYEFRRTYYVPIREKMKDQAFRNRAKNVLDTLANRKGATILREHDDPDSVLNEIEIDDSFDGEAVIPPASAPGEDILIFDNIDAPAQPVELSTPEDTNQVNEQEQKPHEFLE